MARQLTLSKSRPAEIGLDQPQLYAIGLDHVRRLASRIWTDHNVHDPGITTLELLSYALTDLTYRASLPIKDLFQESTFFTARSALPNQPLTILDYRKLIIDVDGVKNAWMEPVDQPYFADTATGGILRENPNRPGIQDIAIRGLYRVRIDYADDKRTDADKAQVNAAVLAQIHKHRNLCEDILDLKSVERHPFILCGEVDLEPEAETTLVHAEILRQVQQYLAPAVRRYSLSQMLARLKPDGTTYSASEVFEGPRLEHGFIDSAELEAADLLPEVRLSDVIERVMNIDGVLAVRDMIISPVQAQGAAKPLENRWVVVVDKGKEPTLDTARSRLVYYKRHMPIVPAALKSPPPAASVALAPEDLPVPRGTSRNVKDYDSFQHHFPAVYGIGEQGLPDSVGPKRLALAAQLKAYLLFFDQVMANYCAQLARISQLFSTDPAVKATYFSQVVSALPGFARIYGVPDSNDAATVIAGQIDPLLESEPERVERRNRFLDHLIARFAEQFHDFASIMRSKFGATDASLIADKCAFLNDYPVIGGDRGLAYNYTLKTAPDSWNTTNVSGLEKRLARLLGIANSSRRDLTDVTIGADAKLSGDAATKFGFVLRHAETQKVLIEESSRLTTADLAQKQMLRAFELGQLNSTYVRTQKPDHNWFFTIVAKDGEIMAQSHDFATEGEMEAAIVELRGYLRQRYTREGMFLIENLLLRPEQDGDPSLHFCVDPDCIDCAGDDPYSYRVHVILPAYAGRFNDMDFRRFAEEVIREEMPAHVLPKICWIDEASMAQVQKAYREWLEIRSGAVAAGRAARMKALVDGLTTVKSVYPVTKLTPCDAPENQDKFILGRTAIGSKKD